MPTATQNARQFRWTTIYDKAGRKKISVEPRGAGTQIVYNYDDAGRVYEFENQLGFVTTTIYDKAGQPRFTVDPLGRRTTYGYDAAGRRITVENSLALITQTRYDAAGRAVTTRNARDDWTTTIYDKASRQIALLAEQRYLVFVERRGDTAGSPRSTNGMHRCKQPQGAAFSTDRLYSVSALRPPLPSAVRITLQTTCILSLDPTGVERG